MLFGFTARALRVLAQWFAAHPSRTQLGIACLGANKNDLRARRSRSDVYQTRGRSKAALLALERGLGARAEALCGGRAAGARGAAVEVATEGGGHEGVEDELSTALREPVSILIDERQGYPAMPWRKVDPGLTGSRAERATEERGT